MVNSNTEYPPILYTPVSDLPVIDELKDFMNKMGFENLKEMLRFSAPDLLKTKGFTYRCLRDLLCILEKHNCEEELRERD